MAHLGVVYRFMLREHRKPDAEHRLLGSIDGAGTRLCDVAGSLLGAVNYQLEVDGLSGEQPIVTFKSAIQLDDGDRVAAVMNHYEHGSRGVLNRHAQGDTTDFTEIDNQQVEVAVVVAAPPMQRAGFIAFHVPNRRGVKVGVESELRRLLRDGYNLHLEMAPVVPLDALEAAIDERGLGRVAFRRLTNPAGIYEDEQDWWTDDEDLGGVELRLTPAKSARLVGRKLVNFIRTIKGTLPDNEDPVEFSELATFDERTYEELSVEVYMGGRKKVVRVSSEGHSMSNAFSWELGVPAGSSHEELVAALDGLIPRD